MLDLEYPFHAAQDLITPAVVVPTDDGPPALGVAGWLAHLDHKNVAISRVEFTENAGDRGWGLVFHLLETAGQSGRCRLRLFRNPTWARQVDFLGETIIDLSVEGDAVQVDLTPHELARVEVTLGMIVIRLSGEDRLDDLAVHVGQAEVAALEAVGQPGVLDPQQVQDRGVEVVDLDRVLDDVVGEVVGLAVDEARLDAAAGQPDREAARVMVAAVIRGGELALRVDRPAELAAPDDQRVVEQPALLEVLDECGGGLVGVVALRADLVGQVAVLVPAHVIELDEPDAALGQAAGEQAIRGVAAGLVDVGAVHV